MTAKERVLEHLPRWSEEQAERALLAAEARRDVESHEEREWPRPFGALTGTLPELEIDDIKAARRAALQGKTG
jgi:hypothetical protein